LPICRVFNRKDIKKNTVSPPPPLLYSSPVETDLITPAKSQMTGTTQTSSISCNSYDDYNQQYQLSLDYSNVSAYFQDKLDNPTSNTPVFFNNLDEYSDLYSDGLPSSVASHGMIRRHCKLADQYNYSVLPEPLMGSSNSNGSPATITEYYAGGDGYASSATPAPKMVDTHSLVNVYN